MTAIFLVGARASGKTTVGRRLAEELGRPFVDTDLYMKEALGLTVADIVEREGWAGFRRWESEALRAVSVGTRPQVVATGGGMVLAETNRALMRERGLVFYLAAPAEALAARLAADPQAAQRPNLTGQSLIEEVAQILKEREPLYQAVAHHQIEATTDLEQVIAAIVEKIKPEAQHNLKGNLNE
ncbi:MAG: shikimate kinase AroL [Candidatus Adiutrix sp.]|jgi:shikimate kinase|nr:shikimate kinase AroL [Candidatus Adiutrix sp.]